jgi:hypothetical protein
MFFFTTYSQIANRMPEPGSLKPIADSGRFKALPPLKVNISRDRGLGSRESVNRVMTPVHS